MSQRILVLFDGRTDGTVERMGHMIAEGARGEGVEAVCERVDSCEPGDLLSVDGLIIGTPCYFGAPTARIKAFLDGTYGLRGQLAGRVGGAFTASEHIGGGNELTLRSLHDFFLIHGMVIQGDAEGDHFGPVGISPSGESEDVVVDDSGECNRLGRRVARLVTALRPGD
jgi:NAD(P)H dehydrogenase (quinone)